MQSDVLFGVAFAAGRAEIAGVAAPYHGPVLVMVGALQRMFARGMAVHAARMGQHFADFGKDRAGALGRVGDGLKFRWRLERSGWGLRERGRPRERRSAGG